MLDTPVRGRLDDWAAAPSHPVPDTFCDLVRAEATLRSLTVGQAVEVIEWLEGLRGREPLRTPRPGWEPMRQLIDDLISDLYDRAPVVDYLDARDKLAGEEAHRRTLAKAEQRRRDLGLSVTQAMVYRP